MAEFVDHLKRSKLVQWAAAYVAASFAALQGLDIVAQRFGWPEAIVRLLIVALVVGFFVTLVLAWYHGERGEQRVSTTELAILAVLLAIGGGLLWRVGENSRDSASVPTIEAAKTRATEAPANLAPVSDKSIAVLPFESLSDDKANAYFAVGVQDEILTRLAKIGALKVISRTSTAHYTSSPDNLPQIARQLGVANILEGSVQKAGEAVHINVQLIRAATDEHLWAESYNRKLDDIFGVEGEVAQTIAERLKATLTGAETEQVSARLTRNPAAYDAYLRGLDAERRVFGPGQLADASRYFAQATHLDPDFAAAWAHGSDADGLLYFQAFDHSETRLQAARRGAENAMRLEPDSAEGWLAKGSFLYHTQDFAGAETAFAEAARRQPNSPDILAAQGYLERRRGNYAQALRLMERSLDRDPQNVTNLASLAETLAFMARHAEARVWYERALTLRPNDPSLLVGEAASYMYEGNLDAAGRILEPMPLQVSDAPSLDTQMEYLFYRRRFGDIAKALKPLVSAPDFVVDGWTSNYYVALGWSERLAGDEALAKATFSEGRRRITALRATWNDNGYLASSLAMLGAGLGDADAVEREGRRSLELVGSDKFIYSGLLVNFAGAQALAGRKEQALAALDQAQAVPGVQYGDLHYSSRWDSLRDDPRFLKLLTASEAALKTASAQ